VLMEPGTATNCPACGWPRSAGCVFGCPEKKPPAEPGDYRHWADLQIEKWREMGQAHVKRCPVFKRELEELGRRIDRRQDA